LKQESGYVLHNEDDRRSCTANPVIHWFSLNFLLFHSIAMKDFHGVTEFCTCLGPFLVFTSVVITSQVYYRLHLSDLYGYYYNGLNLQDDPPEECTPVKTTFFDGLYYEPVNVSHDGDVYRIFRVCVLFVFSNVPEEFMHISIKLSKVMVLIP